MKREATITEQIKILKNRNLNIEDSQIDNVKNFLKNNNYYKVTGYLYKYKLPNSENFNDEITLEKLLQIYEFDESLRMILLKILGVVEVSFKTYIAYTLAINYGPLGYLNSNNFFSKTNHSDFLNIINGLVNQRKNKKRIQHNILKNGSYLPIWVLIDILSFNNIACLYENMLDIDRDEINKDFLKEHISPKIISKWLNQFAILRNDCAHHERIYYENLPNIDIKTKVVKSSLKNNNDNLFSYLLCLSHLVYSNEKWVDFIEDLESIINKYYLIDIEKIGFPTDWKLILLKEIE